MPVHIHRDDFNAKGDLLVATADNTMAILSVGTDGQLLVADSTASNGIKWSDRTLFIGTADKTVTNTVTETSIVPTGVGSLTLAANYLTVGKTIRMRIGGIYSTPVASTPSVLIKIKLGTTVIATVTTTGLLAGASSLEFDGEILITCRSTGASGSVMVHGDIEYATGIGGTISVDPLNNSGAVTTVDTTASKLLDTTITWDSATASRSVKTTICTVEALN